MLNHASTRGIGYAIAETFALEGGTVWMACRNLEVATAEFPTGQIMGVYGGFGIPTPVYGDTMNMALKR